MRKKATLNVSKTTAPETSLATSKVLNEELQISPYLKLT